MRDNRALERWIDRLLWRQGRYLAVPRRLKWTAKLPPIPERWLRSVLPRPGSWERVLPPEVPATLQGCPGIVRHEDLADQAFAQEGPVPHFTSLHSKAIEFVFSHLWMSILPTAPQLMRANRRAKELTARNPPVPTEPVDTGGLTTALRAKAEALGISAVGIAPYDERYAFAQFQGAEVGKTVVVCVLEQNYAATQTAPSAQSELAVMSTYTKLVTMGCELAVWLNERGYRARVGDPDGRHIYIHYGVQAGLGQLGLNGQLLTRQAGSRCRLIVLETDAPLDFDEPKDFGMTALCDACKICVRRCPSGAIPPTRKVHRGIEKVKIRTDRCLPLVAQAEGCAVCMKVCPVQKYGLDAVLNEFEATGRILGAGTDELEGYYWPPDRRYFTASEHPRVTRAFLNPPEMDFDPRRRPSAEPGATAFE